MLRYENETWLPLVQHWDGAGKLSGVMKIGCVLIQMWTFISHSYIIKMYTFYWMHDTFQTIKLMRKEGNLSSHTLASAS